MSVLRGGAMAPLRTSKIQNHSGARWTLLVYIYCIYTIYILYIVFTIYIIYRSLMLRRMRSAAGVLDTTI